MLATSYHDIAVMGKLRGKFQSFLPEVKDTLGLTPLDEWHYKWNEEFGPRLTALYLFSPEYMYLLEQTWKEYDALEADRRESLRPPLEWQPEFSQRREAARKLLEFRKTIYSPMTEAQMSVAPLQALLHHELETPTETLLTDRMSSWRATLDNWECFQKQVVTRASFFGALSAAQRTSFQILQDWWDSSYSDLDVLRIARGYMESRRDEENYSAPFDDEEVIRGTCMDASLYHADCFRLFCHEFHPRSWEPFTSHRCILSVTYQRQQASLTAISQRFAYSVVNAHSVRSRLPIERPYVRPARLDNKWFAKVDREDQGHPFYLWDAVQRKTIEVGEVCPEYICISHTWGRWRIKDKMAELPGVGWLVPENSLYDVRDVPDMLGRLGDRYIWFDLFCVPQIRGDKRAEIEISRQAAIFRHSRRCIAWLNQCPSFDGVIAALRWLSFQFVRMTTRNAETSVDLDRTLETLVMAARSPVELVACGLETQDVQADPWFTSVWTLQEIVVCPEIELYSRDWQRLGMPGGDTLNLTTFAVFISTAYHYCLPGTCTDVPFSQRDEFFRQVSPLHRGGRGVDYIRDYPLGVRSLMALVFVTQLDQVLIELSPMCLLSTLGRREYKKRDRAPAIMSVIGVTDWYKERLVGGASAAGSSQDTILFGIFSLEFVREAARKIGSPFFTGSTTTLDLDGSGEAERGPGGFVGGRGTMIPISHVSAGHSVGTVAGVLPAQGFVDPRNHPSVAGWTIHGDASVGIESVGIAAFSGSQTPVECEMLRLEYASNEPGGPRSIEKFDTSSPTDFSRQLASIAGGAVMYAVALSQSEQHQTGVLLVKLPNVQRLDSRERLVKVGSYYSVGLLEPSSTEVDWLVL